MVIPKFSKYQNLWYYYYHILPCVEFIWSYFSFLLRALPEKKPPKNSMVRALVRYGGVKKIPRSPSIR